MVFKEILPDKRLQNEINCFWYYQDEVLKTTERVIPDGCIEVIFHLGNRVERTADAQTQLNPRSNIIGQMTKPYVIKANGQLEMLGIRFFPHGAARYFDFSLSDLKDKVLCIDAVWDNDARYLEEQVLESGSYQEAISLIEKFLLKKRGDNISIRKMTLTQLASKKILENRGQLKVEQLANELGISRRYLEMIFKDYVGLSPKNFARIAQFQHVFSVLDQPGVQSFTQLAYQCHYADQAHFIRTCRELTGVAPKAFFKESSLIHQNFRSEDNISHLFNF